MRFGNGEAPGRRTHSEARRESHGGDRIAAAPDRDRRAAQEVAAATIILSLLASGTAHAAGRITTPCGISPIVAMRQSAMRSLRASATTIFLRRPGAPSTRALNQSVSALSF